MQSPAGELNLDGKLVRRAFHSEGRLRGAKPHVLGMPSESLEGSRVSPVPHAGTKPLCPSLPTPQRQASHSGLLKRNRRAPWAHQGSGRGWDLKVPAEGSSPAAQPLPGALPLCGLRLLFSRHRLPPGKARNSQRPGKGRGAFPLPPGKCSGQNYLPVRQHITTIHTHSRLSPTSGLFPSRWSRI